MVMSLPAGPKLALIDANEPTSGAYRADYVASIVGYWLIHEAGQAHMKLTEPRAADIILLVHAGAINFVQAARRELRRHGIEPDAGKRAGPYIIAGGAIASAPFTVMEIANAVAVGEGYAFVRELFRLVRAGASLAKIKQWIIAYPHALERSQLAGYRRDHARPWLLAPGSAGPIADPDGRIDWSVPPIRSDDKVVQVMAAKGCPNKCKFCATSWEQHYQYREDGAYAVALLRQLKNAGERVRLVSNDPAALPWFPDIDIHLDAQSFTFRALKSPAARAALMRSRPSSCRIGVEGLSYRQRVAYGKPIANDALLALLADVHGHKLDSHLFFIVCGPYETEADWQEYAEFYYRLSRAIVRGVCRVKYTTFTPAPPAPLARFVPGGELRRRPAQFKDWVARHSAGRHMFSIWPRGPKTVAEHTSDLLSAPPEFVRAWVNGPGCMDLAPSVEDACRLPWEVIKWPWSPESRWKAAGVYARAMESG
jgi:radical SAM superfamily enzyme YgiQ (UPF0313 family)